jgi:hypothetical protein
MLLRKACLDVWFVKFVVTSDKCFSFFSSQHFFSHFGDVAQWKILSWKARLSVFVNFYCKFSRKFSTIENVMKKSHVFLTTITGTIVTSTRRIKQWEEFRERITFPHRANNNFPFVKSTRKEKKKSQNANIERLCVACRISNFSAIFLFFGLLISLIRVRERIRLSKRSF